MGLSAVAVFSVMPRTIRKAWQGCNPLGCKSSTREQQRESTKAMELKLIVEELQAMRGDLQGLREDLRHYKGFIGGVAWMMGGMAAVFGFVVSWLKGEMLS